MRIAEYKQIDTEIKETQVPVLDENGNETGEFEIVRKEIPVMGLAYRNATLEEEARAQAEEIKLMLYALPTSVEEKIQMLAEQITEVFPEGTMQCRSVNSPITLPFKVGYKWEKKLVGTQIMYESVPDPNAIGTENNPIIYTEESPLIDNAWYLKDGMKMVYMQGEFIEM